MKEETDGKNAYISSEVIDRKWIDVNIPCKAACPIMTDIPGYIQAIMEGDYETAYRINRMDNVLPGVLGRVCTRPCETACRHGRDGLGDPVSICFLKRSSADFGREAIKPNIKPNGKKVCIIGAGPSGLTAANDLALRGYQTTILEQFNEPGGMLRYGIPRFRLPFDVLAADVKSITDLGVTLKTGVRIEAGDTLETLKKEYDAVISAGGCAVPKKLTVPGIDTPGVYWGLDFMIAANNNELNQSIEKVVIIGGGFTAADCSRMALRLGAKQVTVVDLGTRDDMLVDDHEIAAMEAEGIQFSFLVTSREILAKDGRASGIRFARNAVKEDRSFVPIPGSEFEMEADLIVFAIGQKADENMERRPGDNFFIAGDFRNGASTVIEAAADGRRAAREVHKFLSGKDYKEVVEIREVKETGRVRDYDFIPRQRMDETPLYERMAKTKEVELGFSKEKALVEARRCYLCHYNFQIDISRCIYCLACIDVMPVDCIKMAKDIEVMEDGNLNYIATKRWDEVQAIAIDNDKCIRCGNCVRACPVNCISISRHNLVEKEE